MLFEPRWIGGGARGLIDARLGPVAGVAAGTIGGLVLSRDTALPMLVFIALALLGAAICLVTLRRRILFSAAVAMGVLGASGAWFDVRVENTPAARAARVIESMEPSPLLCELRVMLLETPEQSPYEPVTPFAREELLRARARVLAGGDANGVLDVLRGRDVMLHLPAGSALDGGDTVLALGLLRPPRTRQNPGERDYRLHASQENLVGSLVVDSPTLVEPDAARGLRESLLSRWLGVRATLKARARAIVRGEGDHGENDRARVLLSALILGDRERGDGDIRESFTSLGLAHVMAISGFHVAVMVGVVPRFVRVFWEAGRHEPLLTIGVLACYLVVVAPNPPIWRASIMTGSVILGEAMGRRYSGLGVLCWTAVVMLALAPLDLWDMGFQLSFLLVGVLMVVCPVVHQRLWGMRVITDVPRLPKWWEGPLEWLRALLTTSLACWSIATPIVALHTGTINLLSIPATVIIVPPTVLLLVVAYPALLLGVLAPPLGGALSTLAGWIAGATAWLVDLLDNVPFATLDVPPISVALTVAFALACLHLLLEGAVRSWRTWIVCTLIGVWTIAELRTAGALSRGVVWRLDTFSVGDGTWHLLRSGREALVWDCGSLSRRLDERTIRAGVRGVGGHRASTAVVTHPNLDHYNFMGEACGALHTGRLYVSQAVLDQERRDPDGELARSLGEARAHGVRVEPASRGGSLTLGTCVLTFLSPPGDCTYAASNDHSLVGSLRSGAGEATLMLTGDIQRDAIRGLIECGVPLRHDVMEAPHHGSFNDAAYEIVSQVSPRVVVQSTGPRRLGETRWDRLKGVTLWRATASHGWTYVEAMRDGSLRVGSMR